MDGPSHLTRSLADDFAHDRLSERDQSAAALHLEECEDCRKLVLSLIPGAESLIGLASFVQLSKMNKSFTALSRMAARLGRKNGRWQESSLAVVR